MISLSGQLAIRTIHGRNGAFNVGRLSTSIGDFVVKNPELDQYHEGKYDGDFLITAIRPTHYLANGRLVIEIRAQLDGMTLSGIDALSNDDASRLSTEEPDPADEPIQPTAHAPQPSAPNAAPAPAEESSPPQDTPSEGQANEDGDDAKLFGPLWPLSDAVKLDATVDRRRLRQQCDRLHQLGYEFAPLSQDWHRVSP